LACAVAQILLMERVLLSDEPGSGKTARLTEAEQRGRIARCGS
jgi:MoxR-like ATPase